MHEPGDVAVPPLMQVGSCSGSLDNLYIPKCQMEPAAGLKRKLQKKDSRYQEDDMPQFKAKLSEARLEVSRARLQEANLLLKQLRIEQEMQRRAKLQVR